MYKRIGNWLIIFLTVFCLITCSAPSDNSNITTTNLESNDASTFRIWWYQGFLPEENTLIAQLVDDWQKESGMKASLRLVPVNLLDAEVAKALASGNPPDVLHSTSADTNLYPKLAWKNELADLSEIIEPMKDSYLPTSLQTVKYQNGITNKRSYYAAPIGQWTPHVFYWRNLLEESGFKDTDIPKDWDNYWEFWKTVQTNLRNKKGSKKLYGIGLPMSDVGTDTFLFFEPFLDAYGVKVLDDNGKLIIDETENKEKIIKALKKYTGLYLSGYVPPQATEWTDSGNNISFLENESVMTVNATLSIPLTQRLPKNKYNETSRDLYFNKIVTANLPSRVDGNYLTSIVGIKQVVIFEKSKYKDEAKSFMKYFLRPDILGKYLKEGNKGRLIPVMPKLLDDPFWKDNDPHFAAVINQFFDKPTRPSYAAINPAYSIVLDRNIWSKAVLSIAKDKVSPEEAANKAISQIVDIFANWK